MHPRGKEVIWMLDILSEIDVSGEEMESLIREANELLQETESMI